MDAHLSWTDAGHSDGGNSSSLLLAVGLSNNSVQAFSIRLPGAAAGSGGLASGRDVQAAPCIVPLVRADCSEICLLYSMSLLHRKQSPPQQQGEQRVQQRRYHPEPGQQQQQQQEPSSQSRPEQAPRGAESSYWLVAAGTIFLDVLVWATPLAANSQLAPVAAVREVPPLLRLQGHEGSIHRVRWSPCGRLLASASDDRSLRLWDVPALPPAACDSSRGGGSSGGESDGRAAALRTLQRPRHVLWGHTARLWDCCYGGSSFLVTASEDCSCRLWCLATGSLLATVPGHRGRGIWHCALLEQPPAIHTGQQAAEGGTTAAAGAAGDAEEQAEAAAAAAAARCVLFTSGADGSIKTWHLSDWLPAGTGSSIDAAASSSCDGGCGGSTLGSAAESFRLRGMPLDPAFTSVGSSAGYGWAHAREQCGPASGGADTAAGRDSRSEWVRCLALAPTPVPAANSSARVGTGVAVQQRDRPGGQPGGRQGTQRLLYVATNRGLLHRVHLPDAELQHEERWVCLARSASARPILALQLLQQPPTPGPPPGGSTSSASSDGSNCCDVSASAASASPFSAGGGLWVATADLAGTATVLLDQPTMATAAEAEGAPGASDAAGMGSGAPGPACCWRWQPYGSGQGPMHVGIWWATGSSHSSGARGDAGGLGCRVVFTTSGEGHVTAWQLPPAPLGSDSNAAQQQCLAEQDVQQQQQQQQQQPQAGEQLGAGQQPFRLAEALLPFASPATCLAAALLPLQVADGWRAALLAAGDTQGGVAALLLLLPPAVLADLGPAAAAAGKRPAGRLLVLAAARRVHELTPVRTIQVAVPTAAERAEGGTDAGAQLARQLAEAEVLTAGGDNIVRTLRLPAAGIRAAVSAALAPAPTEPPAAAAADGPAPGTGDTPGACVAPPPRLLGTGQRHCEAVTHIDGLVRSPGGGGGQGSGLLVFGHFSTHFSVWDDAAEAEVARVPAGGWRRPCTADVAAGDDLAVCYLRDRRLWLHRRRPSPDAAPRALLPPLHGKEQECLRLLGLPGNCHARPAALCCITGGEDCLLRQQLLPLHPARAMGSTATPAGAFACSALLAEHAQGTAVKTLALLPMPGRGSGTACGCSTAEWLLLSAGARQVLMACRLRQDPSHAGQPGVADGQHRQAQPLLPLLCDELAVKEPPALPRRPKPGDKLESDQRYLSISAFLLDQHHHFQRDQHQRCLDQHHHFQRDHQHKQQQQQQPQAERPLAQPALQLGGAVRAGSSEPASGALVVQPPAVLAPPLPVFVVAAASDASLELLCADLAGPRRELGTGRRAQQWRVAAALRHHACPVLCTARCALPAAAPAGAELGLGGNGCGTGCDSSGARSLQHIVLSGATDGSVAVWDVTPVATAAALATVASAAARAAPELAGEVQEQPLAELSPVLVLTGLHQSGVNDVAAVPAGNGRLLLLTGGDDQALCLTMLQLSRAPGGGGGVAAATPAELSSRCSVLLQLSIPTAHSSAIRSVWLEAPAAAGPASRQGEAPVAGDAGSLAAAAFSVGLDQQVRCWRLHLQQQQHRHQHQQQAASLRATADGGDPNGLGPSDAGAAAAQLDSLPEAGSARYHTESSISTSDGSSGGSGSIRLEAEEAGCVFTQVVEPTSLDVLPVHAEQPARSSAEVAAAPGSGGERRYHVGVAGRGSEVLTWRLAL
ncbi:hypothetical protein ABPG77_008098 [Micractinium sp. CCAP 211/92]